jgi:hypothetical protein
MVNDNGFLSTLQKGFNRSMPNRTAFVNIPQPIVEDIGLFTHMGGRIDLVALSTMAWYGQQAVKKSEDGDSRFQLSMLKASENIWNRWFFQTPDTPEFDRFYRRIQKSFARLKETGHIVCLGIAHPEGHTTMGSFWTFGDTPMEPYLGHLTTSPSPIISTVMRDASKGNHIDEKGLVNVASLIGHSFSSLAPSAFRMAEICHSKSTRGIYAEWLPFVREVARTGAAGSRFTSIGAIQSSDIGKEDPPVLIPWVVIDIDRQDPFDSHSAMMDALYHLEERGVDMNAVQVVCTGGKGYHIRIPSGLFGNPVFQSSTQARKILLKLFEIMIPIDVDGAVASPSQLIRIVGGKRNGIIQAQSFKAIDVIEDGISHEQMVGECLIHKSSDIDDPTLVKADPELVEWMIMANDLAQLSALPEFNRGRELGEGELPMSSIVNSVLNGVEESQEWHPQRDGKVYMGRNLAMFIAACHFIKDENLNDNQRWAELQRVNQLNTPPLRISELNTCFKSARRRAGGNTYGSHR